MQWFQAEFGAILARWDLANSLGICSFQERSSDRLTTMEIMFLFDIAPSDSYLSGAIYECKYLCSSVGLDK